MRGEREVVDKENAHIERNQSVMVRKGADLSTPFLLPLWEKVDRRVSAETDEGCWKE